MSAQVLPLRRPDEVEDPMARVNQAIATVLAAVNERKEKRVVARTTRLYELLSGTSTVPNSPTPNEAAKNRIAGVKRTRQVKYTRDQCNDLLLIVFALKTVDRPLRTEAGAMLFLDRDQVSLRLVHQALPGLKDAIDGHSDKTAKKR